MRADLFYWDSLHLWRPLHEFLWSLSMFIQYESYLIHDVKMALEINNILDRRLIILKAILRNNCNFSLYLELDKNLSS